MFALSQCHALPALPQWSSPTRWESEYYFHNMQMKLSFNLKQSWAWWQQKTQITIYISPGGDIFYLSTYLAVCLSIYPCGHLIDIYPHPGGDLSRRGKTEPSFTLNIWSSDILIYLLMWYIIFVDVIKLYVWKPLMKYICWDIQIWNKAWLKIGVEDEDLAKVEVLEIPKRGGDTAHLQKVKRCGHTLQRRLWWSESQRPGSTACGWNLIPTSAPVLQIMLWAAFLSSKYNCNMLFKFYRFNWIT